MDYEETNDSEPSIEMHRLQNRNKVEMNTTIEILIKFFFLYRIVHFLSSNEGLRLKYRIKNEKSAVTKKKTCVPFEGQNFNLMYF